MNLFWILFGYFEARGLNVHLEVDSTVRARSVTRVVNLQLQPDPPASRLLGDIRLPLSSPASRKRAS